MEAKVISNRVEATDARTIRFQLGNVIDFKPGQFAMIKLDVVREGVNKIERKPYSIASPPGHDYIEITVKKMNPGPFSTRLCQLKQGDKAEVELPFGLFTYTKDLGNNIVLIGAGSGIVPLMCITRYNIENATKTNMLLIYSNKTEKDIIYYEELVNLDKQYENFKLFNTLTQDETWKGMKGRIDTNTIKKLIPDYTSALFYICGPPSFVTSIVQLLSEMGVEKSKIKTERYD